MNNNVYTIAEWIVYNIEDLSLQYMEAESFLPFEIYILNRATVAMQNTLNKFEVEEAFDDLRTYEVDVLTLGQYLRPSLQHLPVERYVSPEEFEKLGRTAESKGFLYVASGPMVRSSYRAAELFMKGHIERNRR